MDGGVCECSLSLLVLMKLKEVKQCLNELEGMVHRMAPGGSPVDIRVLDEAAAGLASRGVKLTMKTLIAEGVAPCLLSSKSAKARLSELKRHFNTQRRTTNDQLQLQTDSSGYLLSGFSV